MSSRSEATARNDIAGYGFSGQIKRCGLCNCGLGRRRTFHSLILRSQWTVELIRTITKTIKRNSKSFGIGWGLRNFYGVLLKKRRHSVKQADLNTRGAYCGNSMCRLPAYSTLYVQSHGIGYYKVAGVILRRNLEDCGGGMLLTKLGK